MHTLPLVGARIVAPLLLCLALMTVSRSHAGAVIQLPSGSVVLGVNDLGHLNYVPTSGSQLPANPLWDPTAVGVSYNDGGAWYDGVAVSLLYEGWGVSANGVGGSANVAGGTAGLTLSSFSSTASTAVSTSFLTNLSSLQITHSYAPSQAADTLFESRITLLNTSTSLTLTNVSYARAVDWDINTTLDWDANYPGLFEDWYEYLTIQGTGSTSSLVRSHNNPFVSTNPLTATSPLSTATLNQDVEDYGPEDQGAYFLFNFGNLAPGESRSFSLYYGAATRESTMLSALGKVGAELYSLGQATAPGSAESGSPYTYALAFSDVGGQALLPAPPAIAPVPEPGTYGLMAAGALAGLVLWRRRKISAQR